MAEKKSETNEVKIEVMDFQFKSQGENKNVFYTFLQIKEKGIADYVLLMRRTRLKYDYACVKEKEIFNTFTYYYLIIK